MHESLQRNRLIAEGLAAWRGERLVLREVSFTAAAGAGLVLLGPNGAGKSTLLRVLAGLKRPDAGRLLWGDEDARNEDALADLASHARRVAYVGHLDAVKLGLSAAENLRLSAGPAAAEARPAVSRALEALGLTTLADLPARMLSAGQRRRLALARLALSPAPIWLLDEPTVGLDAAALERLGVLLAGHRARGGIVVAATHLDLPLPGADSLRLG